MRLPISHCLLGCLILVSSVASADQWEFKKGIHEYPTSFGDVRFVATVDARKNRLSPTMWLDMYVKHTLLARIQAVNAGKILPSENRQAFIVLSNSGPSPVAALVLDRSGQILSLLGHDSEGMGYCNYSVTIDRTWYDEANPDAKFEFDGVILRSASVRGCDGNRVTLYGQ